MADGTRWGSMKDSIRKVEALLQQLQQIKAGHESNQESLQEPSSLEAWSFMTSTQNFTTECDKQCEEQKQFHEEIETPIQEIEALGQEIESNQQFVENPKEMQFRLESLKTREENELLEPDADEYIDESKVIPNPLEARMFDVANKEMGESGEISIDSSRFEKPDYRWIAMEFLATPNGQQLFVELPIKLADFRVNSMGFSEFLCAHKLFVERPWQNLGETGMNMASQGVEVSTVIAMGLSKQRMLVFDPGIDYSDLKNEVDLPMLEGDGFDSIAAAGIKWCHVGMSKGISKGIRVLEPYDRGKDIWFTGCGKVSIGLCIGMVDKITLVFDPGGVLGFGVISVDVVNGLRPNSICKCVISRKSELQILVPTEVSSATKISDYK